VTEGSPTTAVDARVRCEWAPVEDPASLAYHDLEWGVPTHGERALFEMLTLEGAQAGLSWSTILHKREGYRRAFRGFDPDAVARFTDADVERLLGDHGIVRNRLKVTSTVSNARAIRDLREGGEDLDELLWSFVDGEPVVNRYEALGDLPAETPTSRAMSTELKRKGFRFVGPTVCYAFMQATGMVNDHVVDCFRFAELVPGG
jgi:DNA-3-methyladenine glycosylase I